MDAAQEYQRFQPGAETLAFIRVEGLGGEKIKFSFRLPWEQTYRDVEGGITEITDRVSGFWLARHPKLITLPGDSLTWVLDSDSTPSHSTKDSKLIYHTPKIC